MSYKFLQQIYLWLIRIGLFAIPFLSLYISSNMLFPYITGRNFTFRFIVEAVFLLWVALAVLNKEYLPKPSKLTWAIFIFVLIAGVADIFGVNPYRSVFSNFERMEGYLMIIHLLLYFLVLSSVFKSRKEWQWYFGNIVLASLFVSFYALLQKFGVYQSLQGGNRVDGTIGNPTYLAAYLMFSVFISLMLFSVLKNKFLRYVFLASAVFEMLIIYFTATRGVVLAFIGGGIIALLLYVLFVPVQKTAQKLFKKAALAGLVLLIVVPAALYLFRNSQFIQQSQVLGRLTRISLTEKTIRSRFMIWNMAWQGVKERPVLGWGQENFGVIFSKFYNPELYDQEPWFDRSHDIIFDWLVNAGITGLISYLSLFGAAFILLWRGWRAGLASPQEAIILFTALISYFAQNIFVFDNMNTYYVFFALLAYINSFSFGFFPAGVVFGPRETMRFSPGSETIKQRPAFDKKRQQTPVQFQPRFDALAVSKSLSALAALGILMFLMAYFVNFKPMKQSISLINTLRIDAQGAPVSDVLAQFRHTLDYNSLGAAETREQLAQYALKVFDDSSRAEADRKESARFAVEEMEKENLEIPGDVKYKLFLGNIYISFASADPSYIKKAEYILQEALKQSPTKQPIYFTLAQYYFNIGQAEKALEISRQAADLAPNYVDAEVNLAILAVYMGKDDLAEKVLQRLEEAMDYDPARIEYWRVEDYPKIISAFSHVQNFEKVAYYYEKLLKFKPENAQYHGALAYAYAKIGKKDLAAAEIKKAAELDPKNYKEAGDQLLKMLETGQQIP